MKVPLYSLSCFALVAQAVSRNNPIIAINLMSYMGVNSLKIPFCDFDVRILNIRLYIGLVRIDWCFLLSDFSFFKRTIVLLLG